MKLLISTIVLIFMTSNLWSKETVVSMACNNFPPLKIENPKDNNPGFDIELLKATFSLSNQKIKTTFFPWKRALVLAKSGEYDGLCSCSYTKERESDFYFSDEIGRNSIGLYSLKEISIKNLSDLKNLKVGVVRGYSLEDDLKKYKIDFVSSPSELNLLKMLEIKRIDVIYSFKVVISELLKTNSFDDKFVYTETSSAPYFTCFSKKSKKSKDLLRHFNEDLKKIKADHTYQQLLKKYDL